VPGAPRGGRSDACTPEEHNYEIDATSAVLTNENWIPLEGVRELPLVQSLIQQRRRYAKPLRCDAQDAARVPNALLLDVGAAPVPLHVFSPFMTARAREIKEAALRACDHAWVWPADASVMPALPLAGL
jgi:hypothetical protein